MKTTHIVVLVALAVFLVALGLNLSESVSIYTDFATAKAKTGKQVHIVGTWTQREQSDYDPSRDLFTFYMQDTLRQVELVHFYDPKPVNFEQAEKVVVVGGYDKQQKFVAEKIVMKCPSKYETDDITAGEEVRM
jgi:cytochrome c-type biogenesis protein CcmE